MTQINTNMRPESFYAYCEAWCVSFYDEWPRTIPMSASGAYADGAVRAGIVFG